MTVEEHSASEISIQEGLHTTTSRSKKFGVVCISLALAVAILAAYWRVKNHSFISYDDSDYVVRNTEVQNGFNSRSLIWAFTTGHAGNWHPLTWLSHMLDVQLFGLNPGIHHLMSVAIHVINALLLFWLLLQMTGALWRSVMVAGLFGLHPLHVESVAWVAERKDVLSTFFFLTTIWAYAKYASKPVIRSPLPSGLSSTGPMVHGFEVLWFRRPFTFYLLSLFLFALGLMSKPMLVTTPVLLLLLDFWPLRRVLSPCSSVEQTMEESNRKMHRPKSGLLKLLRADYELGTLLLEKAPFFVLAATSSIITYVVQQRGGAVSSWQALPLGTRLINALVSYVRYLQKTVWPTNLAVLYPHPGLHYPNPIGWPDYLVIGGGTFLVIACVAVVVCRRRFPFLLVGWLWYLVTLLPVIGLIQAGTQSIADRYTYIPLIGIFIVVVWFGVEIMRAVRFGRQLLVAGAAVVLAFCLTLSARQVAFWQNNFTLFNHALRVTGYNPIAHYTLGIAYAEAEQPEKALEEFRSAVAEDPFHTDAQCCLGAALMMQGYPETAIEHYQAALRLVPGHALAQHGMGSALWMLGRREEAIQMYSASVRGNPDFPQGQYSLGVALLETDKPLEAEVHLTEAIRLKKGYAEAQLALGEALAAQQKLEAAAIQLEAALGLRPDARGFCTLGLVKTLQHKPAEALANLRKAVQLDANMTSALNNLAWILATHPDERIRDGKEAVTLAERACELCRWQTPQFIGTLAAAYAETGRFPEAIATSEKARDLALKQGTTDLAQRNEELLQYYRIGKAYHETAKTNGEPPIH